MVFSTQEKKNSIQHTWEGERDQGRVTLNQKKIGLGGRGTHARCSQQRRQKRKQTPKEKERDEKKARIAWVGTVRSSDGGWVQKALNRPALFPERD